MKPPDSYSGEIPRPVECECLESWGSKEWSTKVYPLESTAQAVVKVCGDSSKINGVAVMQNCCEIGIKHFAFLGDINQSSDLFPGKFYFFLTLSIGLPDVLCYWDRLSHARHSWAPSWFAETEVCPDFNKTLGFPKGFPNYLLHSSSMPMWPSTSSPSPVTSNPSCWSAERLRQTIILLPLQWKGVYCNSRRSATATVSSLTCRGKSLHPCLQAFTAGPWKGQTEYTDCGSNKEKRRTRKPSRSKASRIEN